MTKILLTALMVSMVLTVGIALADTQEPCDACTDVLIWLIIENDTNYTPAGVFLSPSNDVADWSCCPDWLDTLTHIGWPDTLPYPSTVDSILSIATVPGFPESTMVNNWWNKDALPGTEILVPPSHTACCCTNGVYWKARMKDAATSTWSAWTDVHAPGQSNTTMIGPLVAMISTAAFKLPDYSGNMQFDCDVDSVIVYVWDCENEPGGEGTLGEFGISARTWPDPATLGGALMDTVWLKLWDFSTGIGDKTPKLPREYFISQNTPNPFNSSTAIQYGLPEEAEVHIEVTNLLGQKVATLVDENQSAGYKRLVWDGRDDMGREMPSGVYFYSIRANSFSDKKRAILMK